MNNFIIFVFIMAFNNRLNIHHTNEKYLFIYDEKIMILRKKKGIVHVKIVASK